MTGGYKIIDLYGLDLVNMQLDSTKIEKIFSDIESTYKTKALLFDNYKINGIEQNATFSSAIVKNSGFEITLGDYKILIKNDSVVDNTLHLYMHNIELEIENKELGIQYVYLVLYNTNKNNYTIDTLKEYIKNFGLTGIGVSGTVTSSESLSTPTTSLPTNIYVQDNNFIISGILDNNLITYNTLDVLHDIITKIF